MHLISGSLWNVLGFVPQHQLCIIDVDNPRARQRVRLCDRAILILDVLTYQYLLQHSVLNLERSCLVGSLGCARFLAKELADEFSVRLVRGSALGFRCRPKPNPNKSLANICITAATAGCQ